MNIVVTISGPHGSGKSTYAKLIAEEFGLRYVSAGMIFRKIAEERKLSLEELAKTAEKDKRIDLEIDNLIKEEAKKGSVVLDGHLAGVMARDYADIKIYLTASLETRVKRIAKREKTSESEALERLSKLEQMEIARWKKLYGLDPRDLSTYDIVLNTELLPLNSTINILKGVINEYIQNKMKHRG